MGTHLQKMGEWAQHLTGDTDDPIDRLDALHRAELRAKADIRAVLDRLASEFNVLTADVDEAMLSVDDAMTDLLDQAESDLTTEIEELA